jgi:hypothetical protein
MQFATAFEIKGKIIWDNVEFERILDDGLDNDPKNYLPPKAINDDVVSIGGWRINVKSTIHLDATAFEVITAYDQINTKLNLPVDTLFRPFFRLDVRNRNFYKSTLNVGELPPFFRLDVRNRNFYKLAREPLVVVFLRLCYWYYKCSTEYNLAKKNKEIRDKLKVSDTLIDSITNNGVGDSKTKEWFRQVVGVVYELMCASLSGQYNTVSFQKKHDFFLENKPVEVKTIFPPLHTESSEFYPYLSDNLQHPNTDLRLVMKNFIKIPKIMENNLQSAIDRQQAEIVFLNLILSNASSALAYLSELSNLTIKNSLHDAINMLSDKSNLPLVVSFHAIHCKYEIFSFVLPIPITRRCPCLSFGGIAVNKLRLS